MPQRSSIRPPVRRVSVLAVVLIMAIAPAAVEPQAPLPTEVPEPLTLAQALDFAAAHPRVTSPAEATELPRRQPLYLGCHSLAFSGARADDADRDTAWSPLLTPLAAQRLAIRQRFYDVLLADRSFARDNEAMAVAYVQFDRAAAREELGQFSPLKTAELEADYQGIRRQRAASEAAQRVTRALLAQALGRPDDLPRDLVTPDPGPRPSDPPALDDVVAAALDENPRVAELTQGQPDAQRKLVEMEVRQQALELLTRLELLDVIAEQARIESDWRDLKLDESRTMYELEVTADLGFSMSQQTKARRDEEQVALCQALTRAELDALQGRQP